MLILPFLPRFSMPPGDIISPVDGYQFSYQLLRFFGSLYDADIAEILGVPIRQPDAGKVGGALQSDGASFAVADATLSPANGPFSVLAWVQGDAVKGEARSRAVNKRPMAPLLADPLRLRQGRPSPASGLNALLWSHRPVVDADVVDEAGEEAAGGAMNFPQPMKAD